MLLDEIPSLLDQFGGDIEIAFFADVAKACARQVTFIAEIAAPVRFAGAGQMACLTTMQIGALLALRTVVTLLASCTNRVGRARTAGDRFAMLDGVAARGAYEGGSGRVRRVIPIAADLALAPGIASFTGGADRIGGERAGHLARTMVDRRAFCAIERILGQYRRIGEQFFLVIVVVPVCALVAIAVLKLVTLFALVADRVSGGGAAHVARYTVIHQAASAASLTVIPLLTACTNRVAGVRAGDRIRCAMRDRRALITAPPVVTGVARAANGVQGIGAGHGACLTMIDPVAGHAGRAVVTIGAERACDAVGAFHLKVEIETANVAWIKPFDHHVIIA